MTQSVDVEPISELQRAEVKRATQQCISRAEKIYNRRFKPLQIDFDLRGKCAGMYQVKRLERRIRFNPWIFAKYYQDSLNDTVAHEVAHYVVDCLYGLRKVKPHGREWQAVMRNLGAEPKATGRIQVLHTLNQSKAGFLEKIVPFFRSTLALTRRHAMGQSQMLKNLLISLLGARW